MQHSTILRAWARTSSAPRIIEATARETRAVAFVFGALAARFPVFPNISRPKWM